MSKNGMLKNEAGKALAHMLKSNNVLTELNLTDCTAPTLVGGRRGELQTTLILAERRTRCTRFAHELAVGISSNGTLSTFTFSGSVSKREPVTMETSMTEANFDGKGLGVTGAIMLAAFLPKCT
jgi:hypothetical protein